MIGVQAQASSTASRVQIRAIALFHLSAGIIVSSLLWGKNVDALKAVGYGWIPFPLYIIDGLFVNKDFVELGLNRGILLYQRNVASDVGRLLSRLIANWPTAMGLGVLRPFRAADRIEARNSRAGSDFIGAGRAN